MPVNKKKEAALTKRQASIINKSNKKISGNINSLLDTIHSIAYGTTRTDKIDNLTAEFNDLLKSEVDNISKTADGDTTSFLTKLFSEQNKRLKSGAIELEELFDVNEGQLEAFLNEQYRNRLIKQADLHEVASQLVELQEAITITRDAIISADIIDGHMSRTLTFTDMGDEDGSLDYLPIIETIEKKFKLQEKIKNFIIPRSLEFGEYDVYCIPYSKIFEDFEKEKTRKGGVFSESTREGITLYDFIKDSDKKSLLNVINESVDKDEIILKSGNKDSKISIDKKIKGELDTWLKNITINNNPIPLTFLDEGFHSMEEYYEVFMEKSITEKNDKNTTFNKVMKGIDTGVISDTSTRKSKSKKEENYSDIHDCYIKLMDPMHLLPIEIMHEVVGYYYIQEDDINPMTGILTSTVYYDNYEQHDNNNVLDALSETIVAAFDKKFLKDNIKFKKLIVEALNYYKLNNKRIKFQFIPKEYIIPFKVNEDENGHGVSIIEPSLFYAKLYLMILLFKIMSIVMNSNDTKVNYIRQSGLEKNVTNKIQEIARKKQQRQINIMDMFSYTTLVNKVGQGSEMYIPVGKSNERGIETEILQGQEVQLNSDLLEMLKKAYISGTGVPDVLMNYIHEAEFAKTLELANNRFQGRVVSYQLDYNQQITEFYKAVLRYASTIPEEIIDSLQFNFVQPKSSNGQVTNELINNFQSLSQFLSILFAGGENELQKEEMQPIIAIFQKNLAADRLPMLNFPDLEKMWKSATIDGQKKILDPNSSNDEEEA